MENNITHQLKTNKTKDDNIDALIFLCAHFYTCLNVDELDYLLIRTWNKWGIVWILVNWVNKSQFC